MRNRFGRGHDRDAAALRHLLAHERRRHHGGLDLVLEQHLDAFLGGTGIHDDGLAYRVGIHRVEARGTDRRRAGRGDGLADEFDRVDHQRPRADDQAVADGVGNFRQHLEAEFLGAVIGEMRRVQHQIISIAQAHHLPVGDKIRQRADDNAFARDLAEIVGQRLIGAFRLLLVQNRLDDKHQVARLRFENIGRRRRAYRGPSNTERQYQQERLHIERKITLPMHGSHLTCNYHCCFR